MTEKTMLKMMLEASERMFEAKTKYESHVGGGASQKIKNNLFKDYNQKGKELYNLTYNLRQLVG